MNPASVQLCQHKYGQQGKGLNNKNKGMTIWAIAIATTAN